MEAGRLGDGWSVKAGWRTDGGWTKDGCRMVGEWIQDRWRQMDTWWRHNGDRMEVGWRQDGGRMEAGWKLDGCRLELGSSRWPHLTVKCAPVGSVEPEAAPVQVEPGSVMADEAELQRCPRRVAPRRQPRHQAPMGAVLRDLREHVPEAAAAIALRCARRVWGTCGACP